MTKIKFFFLIMKDIDGELIQSAIKAIHPTNKSIFIIDYHWIDNGNKILFKKTQNLAIA